MTTAEIRELLKPPVSREVILSIMEQGLKADPLMRVLIKNIIAAAPQKVLDEFAIIGSEALSYIDDNDPDGLDAFLERHNVPKDILKVIHALSAETAANDRGTGRGHSGS